VEAVLRELEGEMAKMRALEKTAGRIDRCRAQGEGEKRGEDELAWRTWVEGHYLPRLKREKEGGGEGEGEEEERVKVRGGTRGEGGGWGRKPSLVKPTASLLSYSLPKSMHQANPSFILRNWIAQDAIEAAEKGDFSRVRLVLSLLQDPFYYPEDREGGAEGGGKGGAEGGSLELTRRYRGMTPAWAADLVCTCSS
jgi:hypothetical protein